MTTTETTKARRKDNAVRPITIETGVSMHAEGSALIAMGNTRVLCTASVEARVPDWLKNSTRGWVTAEYAMLPRATSTRNRRERDKVPSRTLEISRLVGRALRAAVDLEKMPGIMITVDADVLQADGGTRTAAINGGMVALAMALARLKADGQLRANPILSPVAALSVGYVDGRLRVDLDYDLDHRAEVDLNVAMTAKGDLVEVQGSAEGKPFGPDRLAAMVAAAGKGIKAVLTAQRKALRDGGF
ncbi:MAG: ribonuclease PH [Planctomycetes bacterium]|nr:ribonuclease PH [Planctomycetota bacterium]